MDSPKTSVFKTAAACLLGKDVTQRRKFYLAGNYFHGKLKWNSHLEWINGSKGYFRINITIDREAQYLCTLFIGLQCLNSHLIKHIFITLDSSIQIIGASRERRIEEVPSILTLCRKQLNFLLILRNILTTVSWNGWSYTKRL